MTLKLLHLSIMQINKCQIHWTLIFQLLFAANISINLTFFRFSMSESESVSLSLTYFRWFFFTPERSEKARAWSKMLDDVVEELLLEFWASDEVEKS